MSRLTKFLIIFVILTTVFGLLFFVLQKHNLVLVSWAEDGFNYLKIYNARTLKFEKEIPLFENSIGYSMSTIDLGGDGQHEILIGAGLGEKPWVKILTGDGYIINEFLAYAGNFTGGVEVAGCDLDGDGRGEIVTGVRSNGGAHVRVFNGYGQPKINPGFFAYENNNNTGVQIACVDITGDGQDEIATVSGALDSKELKIFNALGHLIKAKKLDLNAKNIKISSIDLGGDGVEEILVTGGWIDEPQVQIYRGDLSLINEFLAYDQNFSGGLNTVGHDIDGDGKDEVITIPGLAGGPHLRMFDGYGHEKITNRTFVFNQDFRGGLNIAAGDIDGDGQLEIVVAPQNLPIGRTDLYKYIDIDVTHQRFKYYQHGFLLGDFMTSTGKPSTPTRLGEFDVISKYEMAYGGADGLYWGMPYFIGFYISGGMENGIHELPFLNGYREGQSSLGHAVSHGCVRLPIGPAQEVYDWAEIGVTKVFVHR